MSLKSSLLRPKTRPLVERLIHPFQAFVHAETSSGVLLLCCTLLALLWANSPWARSYHQVWENHLAVRLAGMELNYFLHVWINDGLMTLFFVLVGLEIKREVLVGELARLRQALLPLLAACGGTTSSGPQNVQVTLSDYKITSSVTTFSAGMPYHFTVTNTGKVAHEFMIMPMGMNMQHMSMDEMHHAALYMFDNVAPGRDENV